MSVLKFGDETEKGMAEWSRRSVIDAITSAGAKYFSSQYYISFLVLSSNNVYTRGKTFSFVYESILRHTLFNWSSQSNIAFTSVKSAQMIKYPRPKAKPSQKNNSNEGVLLLLRCKKSGLIERFPKEVCNIVNQ